MVVFVVIDGFDCILQLLPSQVKEYTDEFSREKESHRKTVQDKIHLQKAVQAKEREIQELQQKVDDHLLTTSGHLHHMWNEESQVSASLLQSTMSSLIQTLVHSYPLYPLPVLPHYTC